MGMAFVLTLTWGRPVLIPFALAVLLTFLLNPVVRILERRGLGRVCSVLVAVSTTGIFLNLPLGEGPALRANVGIYLRLMQGDEHEAARLVLQRMKDQPPDEVFDEMLVPALNYTKRDIHRDFLTDEDQNTVLRGIRECLRHTDLFLRTASAGRADPNDCRPEDKSTIPPAVIKPARILGCPAKDTMDCLGFEMLQQLFDPTHWILELTAVETLTSELVARIVEDPPAIICIASLPPGGMAHARYLCKRLRSASPGIPIIVGRWGQTVNGKIDREQLEQSGASIVTTTLLETRQLLESRLPLLKRVPQAMVASGMSDRIPTDALDGKNQCFARRPDVPCVSLQSTESE